MVIRASDNLAVLGKLSLEFFDLGVRDGFDWPQRLLLAAHGDELEVGWWGGAGGGGEYFWGIQEGIYA